jgi:hypothetical protein
MTPFGKLVFGGGFLALVFAGYLVMSTGESFSEEDVVSKESSLSVPLAASSTTASSTEKGTASTTSIVSFKEKIQEEGVFLCEVLTKNDSFLKEGYVSFNESRIRGDFVFGTTTKATSTFLISGRMIFSWKEGDSGGIKTNYAKTEESSSTSKGFITSFNFNDVAEYNCEETKFDEKHFALPPEITFSELP